MRPHNVRLVKIHAIEVNTNPAVVVKVACRDDHVSVAIGQVNRMSAITDECFADSELHHSADSNAVSLFVLADDFQTSYNRHSLTLHDIRFQRRWVGRSGMSPHKVKRRARSAHHNRRGPIG